MDTGEPLVAFELAQRIIWQSSFEHALEQTLKSKIRPTPPDKAIAPEIRPSVQAAFCIDVRSEVLRRALESTHADIETLGFAGFFWTSHRAYPSWPGNPTSALPRVITTAHQHLRTPRSSCRS